MGTLQTVVNSTGSSFLSFMCILKGLEPLEIPYRDTGLPSTIIYRVSNEEGLLEGSGGTWVSLRKTSIEVCWCTRSGGPPYNHGKWREGDGSHGRGSQESWIL